MLEVTWWWDISLTGASRDNVQNPEIKQIIAHYDAGLWRVLRAKVLQQESPVERGGQETEKITQAEVEKIFE